MKRLIFAAVLMVSIYVAHVQASSNETSERDWLQVSINKCADGDDSVCNFLNVYLRRFYKPMCGGLQFGEVTYASTSNRVMNCITITQALADKNFVKNLLKAELPKR